jgi:hypothetical protein
MGKMVSDVRACVDAMGTFDFIDDKNIFLLGNTIGGCVALLSAALDERIAGVAVVSAFSPWSTSNSRYESIRSLSHLHGFVPRLGFFAEDPLSVPVDMKEIISTIVPRPLLIISPLMDRYGDQEAIGSSMKDVQNVYALYGKSDRLVYRTPLEINRLTDAMGMEVAGFFKAVINK